MNFVCECIFTLAFTSIFGHNRGECGTLAATATVRRRGTVKMVEICVQMDERVGDQAEKEHSTTQRLKQTLADRQLKGMGKCMLTSNVWKYLFYMNFHFLSFFIHSLLQQYFSLYADNDRCFDLPQQHNTAIFWYLVCAWVALYWSWSPLKLCCADWLNPPTAFTATAFKLLSKYFIQHNLILKFVAKHYTSFFSAFAIKDSVRSAKHILNFFLLKCKHYFFVTLALLFQLPFSLATLGCALVMHCSARKNMRSGKKYALIWFLWDKSFWLYSA